MDKKTLAEWEREKGWIVIAPDVDLSQSMTEQDFDAIPRHEKVGVDYAYRIQFLKDNAYPVTRQNMIDPSLSTRTPKEIAAILNQPTVDNQNQPNNDMVN